MLIPGAAVDPLILLFLALILDAAVGDMRWLFGFVPHPVVMVGSLIGFFERRLNRDTRSDATRTRRGAALVLLVVGLAVSVAAAILYYTRQFSGGWLVELFLVTVLIAQRSLYDHVALVA